MGKIGGWPPSGFGGRLRALREEAGLSQGDLAERAGCSTFTVSKLERGTQEPAWPLVLALGKALGVTCQAFNGDAAAEAKPAAPARPRGRPKKAGGETAAKGKGKRKGGA